MRIQRTITDIRQALRRSLRLLTRPIRMYGGRHGLVVQPYRGYGSQEEIFLMGRVFRQPRIGTGLSEGTLLRDLVDLLRRLLRWGVGRAVLCARFGNTEQRVTTDRDGYFRVHMHPGDPPPAGSLWHKMDLELLHPAAAAAQGQVFVLPHTARYVVISDIDDTVMFTGVANKVRMLWRLFIQRAQSRVAFPGVAALYRALHFGVSSHELNPMLYVSRSPWSLYEILDEFFNLHHIPVGPILFLREWGLSLQRPLPRLAKGHKLALIRNMLALYRDLPFILIGDSGQRDPEIYAQVLREYPGRVLAIYIRHVNRDPQRTRDIEALATEVVNAGSTLLLAADSFAMAAHAATHGFISSEALAEVLKERVEQQGEADLHPTRTIERPTRRETREAVRQGNVQDALEDTSTPAAPPNVVVQPEDRAAPTLPERDNT